MLGLLPQWFGVCFFIQHTIFLCDCPMVSIVWYCWTACMLSLIPCSLVLLLYWRKHLEVLCGMVSLAYLNFNKSCSLLQPRESLQSFTKGSTRLVPCTLIWSRRKWTLQSAVQEASLRKLKRRASMDGDIYMETRTINFHQRAGLNFLLYPGVLCLLVGDRQFYVRENVWHPHDPSTLFQCI